MMATCASVTEGFGLCVIACGETKILGGEKSTQKKKKLRAGLSQDD